MITGNYCIKCIMRRPDIDDKTRCTRLYNIIVNLLWTNFIRNREIDICCYYDLIFDKRPRSIVHDIKTTHSAIYGKKLIISDIIKVV